MSGTTELRDADAARRWVEAGLATARTTPATDLAAACSWLSAALVESTELPPAGVVVDLGSLLHGGRLDARAPVPPDTDLQRALASYEHQLLGRLAADRRLGRASDAVLRLAPRLRPSAVGLLLGTFFRRTAPSVRVSIPAGVVRTLARKAVLPDPFAALRDDAPARALLTQGYDALLHGAQRARELITESDVFLVEHLEALEGLAQRVALEEVLAARAALLDGIPRRVARAPRQRGAVSSAQPEEDTYPVGGFSSISNAGSFENLVTSELAAMDPAAAPGSPREVDLFDLRYALGELLFYTRDEATFARHHRLVTVLLGADLVGARSKDPGVPFQRIVLVLSSLHAAILRLLDDLGHEAVVVRFVVPPSGALEPERALLALLFREELERGVAEVVVTTAEEALLRADDAAARGVSQVLFAGSADGPARPGRKPRYEAYELPTSGALESFRAALVSLLRHLP